MAEDKIKEVMELVRRYGNLNYSQCDAECRDHLSNAEKYEVDQRATYSSIESKLRELLGAPVVPQADPVAYLWQQSETGRTRVVMPDMVVTADANWFVVGPLRLDAAPQQPEASE